MVSALCVAVFANRSPLVYLIGAIAVGLVLQKDASAPRRSRRGAYRAILAVGAILTVVVGGAVMRVVLTPEYQEYDEFSSSLREGEYLDIGVWSLRHYAATVGENAVLTRQLVDEGLLPKAYGSSYLSGLGTALPGEQLTLDLQIKQAAEAAFVGGGIPPTLAGEGYVNFGYLGSFLGGFVVASTYVTLARRLARDRSPLDPYIYGYATVYVGLAQVAGLAGASPLPLLMFLVLLVIRRHTVSTPPIAQRSQRVEIVETADH